MPRILRFVCAVLILLSPAGLRGEAVEAEGWSGFLPTAMIVASPFFSGSEFIDQTCWRGSEKHGIVMIVTDRSRRQGLDPLTRWMLAARLEWASPSYNLRYGTGLPTNEIRVHHLGDLERIAQESEDQMTIDQIRNWFCGTLELATDFDMWSRMGGNAYTGTVIGPLFVVDAPAGIHDLVPGLMEAILQATPAAPTSMEKVHLGMLQDKAQMCAIEARLSDPEMRWVISSHESIDTTAPAHTRVYEVGDILDAMEMPEVNLRADRSNLERRPRSVRRVILDCTTTDSWFVHGGETGCVRSIGTRLVITNTADVHRQVEYLLSLIRTRYGLEGRDPDVPASEASPR